MWRPRRRALLIVVLVVIGAAAPAAAAPLPDSSFAFSQWRLYWDGPVEAGVAARSWVWGNENSAGLMREPYAEGVLKVPSPQGDVSYVDGWRAIQYYDKGRMELNHPYQFEQPQDNPWVVTSGLLATELMTGNLQLGDTLFEPHQSSHVPVAGDPDSGDITPSYTVMGQHMADAALPEGTVIIQTLDAAGVVGVDARFADHGVRVEDVGAPTGHGVATVFWDWMNQVGVTDHSGDSPLELVTERIFPNPFYATGYPTTEAYWTRARVGGQERDVLAQCFERRCLTYTPDNPAQWQVEMANIGQHYYHWRYSEIVAEAMP